MRLFLRSNRKIAVTFNNWLLSLNDFLVGLGLFWQDNATNRVNNRCHERAKVVRWREVEAIKNRRAGALEEGGSAVMGFAFAGYWNSVLKSLWRPDCRERMTLPEASERGKALPRGKALLSAEKGAL